MREPLRFTPLTACDLMAMNRLQQASQQVTLGLAYDYDEEQAAAIADHPVAWAVRRAGELIACFGIFQPLPGGHGIGWAILTPAIGASHLALTRFVRRQAETCGIPRLELLARVPDLEELLAEHPGLDAGQIAELVKLRPSVEYRWAVLLGFTPMHLVRFYGPACESYMLCERIDPLAALILRKAA